MCVHAQATLYHLVVRQLLEVELARHSPSRLTGAAAQFEILSESRLLHVARAGNNTAFDTGAKLE